MNIFRLTKEKFSSDLSGNGAKINGGRWNLKGIPCIYAGSTISLCVLEFAVHVDKEDIPENLSIVKLEIPSKNILKLTPKNLPKNRTNFEISQEICTKYLTENNYLAIQIPSIIVPSEFNFLLNPNHADFDKCKIKNIELFELDKRIKM